MPDSEQVAALIERIRTLERQAHALQRRLRVAISSLPSTTR